MQRDAGEDEHRAQDQGAEDAPEQHPELVLRRHGEVAEDHRPDEDVVDREALLDQVAGQVLAGGLPPCQARITNVNARPSAIQTADSIAASLNVMTCAVRWTSSSRRSAASRSNQGEQAEPDAERHVEAREAPGIGGLRDGNTLMRSTPSVGPGTPEPR